MLEYLNFCLLCAIFTLILYLYIQIKKYFPILKMAEELINYLGYDPPQSDTKRQKPLLELAILGRHRSHSLWLLIQSYTAVPNNIRRQAKMLYVWYPKTRTDLNTIHEENDIIGPIELARVKAQLKQGKHTCLIMRMEHSRAYMIR